MSKNSKKLVLKKSVLKTIFGGFPAGGVDPSSVPEAESNIRLPDTHRVQGG
ncbi:hypothetical protein ACSLBF_12785 [Pseudoalteromonas sp. T1lg65]|uniref:hypothetical protein n=1 Tax=Pseudoalteromonas sp. T1lg65 TaxID=2077101 RepID=UPI003F7A402E